MILTRKITFLLVLLFSLNSAINISITSPVENSNFGTVNTSVTFNLEAGPIATCVYTLNGINSSFFECANFSITSSQGVNNLTMHVNDSEGNYNSSSEIHFNVDSIAPQVLITSINTTSSFSLMRFESSEVINLTFSFGVNTNALQSISNNSFAAIRVLNLTQLSQNTTYVYNYTACDSFGNCNFSNLKNFTTNSLPVVYLISPTANSNLSKNFTLNASASDDGNVQLVKFAISNGTWSSTLNASLSDFWIYNFNSAVLTDGQYNVSAIAIDNLNEQSNSNAVQVNIDNTKPLLQLYNLTNGTKTKNSNVTVNFAAIDYSIASCWYSIDGAINQLASCSNFTLINLSNSAHNLAIFANDSQNFTSSLQVNFTVDTQTPVISNVNIERVNATVNLTWATNEQANYTVLFGVNNSFDQTRSSTSFTTTFNVVLGGLEYDRSYNYNITSCDEVGNCANYTASINMPSAPVSSNSQSNQQVQSNQNSASQQAQKPAATEKKQERQNETTANQTLQLLNETQQQNATLTNSTQVPSKLTAFASAEEKNAFAVLVAVLSGLSILTYGYRPALLKSIKSKKGKHSTAKNENKTRRFLFLRQISNKQPAFLKGKKNQSNNTRNNNVKSKKLKFKNGSIAYSFTKALKKNHKF